MSDLSFVSKPNDSRHPAVVEVAELHRQVRNLLALLRAVIRRTARSAQSVEEYAAILESRVGALARIQEILMRGRLNLDPDLLELVSGEFLAQGVQEHQVSVQGTATRLAPEVAIPLALALHELTSNAIRFGGLSSHAGRVTVRWARNKADGVLRFEWNEAGRPAPVSQPGRSGFGRELIEKTLPLELGARTSLRLTADGAHCVLEFDPARSERQRE